MKLKTLSLAWSRIHPKRRYCFDIIVFHCSKNIVYMRCLSDDAAIVWYMGRAKARPNSHGWIFSIKCQQQKQYKCIIKSTIFDLLCCTLTAKQFPPSSFWLVMIYLFYFWKKSLLCSIYIYEGVKLVFHSWTKIDTEGCPARRRDNNCGSLHDFRIMHIIIVCQRYSFSISRHAMHEDDFLSRVPIMYM